MEIGIDELDEFEQNEDTTTQDITLTEEPQKEEEVDIITELLKARGIQDTSKIKFDKGDGEIEEVDWNTLSNEDKLNILNSDNSNENDLDEAEIELINVIRSNKMSPKEYMDFVTDQGVQEYIKNSQPESSYTVDSLSDDELFVADLVARIGDSNITDEEIENALNTAKSNEAVFKKQIDAIRNEYKRLEDNNKAQEMEMQRQSQVENFNRFAETVETEIRNFTDVSGYSLDMDESEMEELYDFITGFDGAGVSVFGKALNDPKTLVQMAWFALNGEKAIQDISDYWSTEIKNVRKNSYNKGVEDALSGKIKNNRKSNVEIRPSTEKLNLNPIDDLDDF